MSLLTATNYDPSTAATVATTAAGALTAFDTANLRLVFTAPANGIVLVRLKTVIHGATTYPAVLLGVLDGAAVKGRQAPFAGAGVGGASYICPIEADFIVSGLTPGNSYTWDAAYDIETGVASSAIKWGGPNDTTLDNAFGGFIYEIWETENLLAGINYDPVAAVSKSCNSVIAMTALDTSNLRLTFTTNASGAGSTNVLVHLRAPIHGSASLAEILMGVLDGSTVRGRGRPANTRTNNSPLSTDLWVHDLLVPVTGLSPNTSYTWDAAYGVEGSVGSNIKYGGPNDATVNNAFGGFTFEIWAA